ncbi:hypothetical protein ACE1B6_10550 [Aerosakkonemataceae cyanobacterium BLCC-F154]|uniref:Uncharacterized protein n=1 Tax=Floridaenema fluviatile BLCC-F154 TaxID=3153640 RepID=A0ABV4YA96_9CYAN
METRELNENTKAAKEYIDRISKQLLTDYQHTKEERHKIALWEDSQEFSILGVIEIFTDDIRGYAAQAIANDTLENPQQIAENLQGLKIFDVPYFTNWYFSHESDYPQIKRYVETLNYLRLLIIEYIN